jgi:hypothetical protein
MQRVVSLLPVCAVEQYGPHLPVRVDAAINAGILERALQLLPADIHLLVLPAQNVGKSDEHIAFPGTRILFLWARAAQLAKQPSPRFEPIALYRAQRHAQRARRVFLAVAAEETALDHIGETRVFVCQPHHRLVQRQQTLIGFDREIGDIRQRDMLTAAPALISDPRLRIVDQCVAHGERGSAQKVRLVSEASRLAET